MLRNIRIIVLIACEISFILLAAKIWIVEEPISIDMSNPSLADDAIYSVLNDDSMGGVVLENPNISKYEFAESVEYEPIRLPKGSYDVTLQYKADVDNNYFTISSTQDSNIDALYAEDLTGFLSSSAVMHTSHIRVVKNDKKVYLKVFYWGEGILDLERVTVTQTNADVLWHLLGVVALLIVLNLVYFSRNWIFRCFNNENYHYTMCIILLVLAVSIPAYSYGIYVGHDTSFHINRMEGLKEAIVSMQFPAKMHSLQLYGYGYATGQMYPQLFLYPESILRILGVSRVGAHRFLILMVNCLTVVISFYSFNKMFSDRSVALAGTALYAFAPYRIVDLYIRDSMGEYCAMIGLPLIAWGLYSFISDRNKDEKPAYIDLAIGYTIVIQSHILTSLFVAVHSVLLGIVFYRALFRKERIVALVKTITLTLLLNAGFIVPFLDYMRLPMNQFTGSIKHNGIDIVQLFTNEVLQNEADLRSFETIADIGELEINNEMPYAIGYALLISTAAFLVLYRKEGNWKKIGITSVIIGGVNAVMALYIFPWDIIQRMDCFSFISTVQFPWRFLEYTTIAFTISGCVGIIYLMNRMSKLVALCLIMLISIYGYANIVDYIVEVTPQEEDVFIKPMNLGVASEYLLENTDPQVFIQRGERIAGTSEQVELSEYNKLGTNLSFRANNCSNEEQAVEVPLTMYPGYKAKDGAGNMLDVTYGDNQLVVVMLPPEYDGEIHVYFGGKWYWKVAAIVSAFTALFLGLYYLRIKCNDFFTTHILVLKIRKCLKNLNYGG